MTKEAQEELESRAKAVGWNPDGEKSAKDYLKGRESNLAIANHDIKALEGQLKHATKTIDQMATAWNKGLEKAHKDGIQQGINQVKSEMRQAAKDGDDEAYAQAERKLEKLEEEKEKKVEPAIDTTGDSGLEAMKETVVSHIKGNKEIFATAQQTQAWESEMKHQMDRLGKPLEEAMAFADKTVIDQFDLGRDIGGPSGGDKNSSRKPEGFTSYADLPQEGKDAYDAIKSKNPDYKIEDYLELVNG